jgi:hypothetical protein
MLPLPLENLKVRELKSVNFSYVAEQDRVLAAINPGHPQAWSCWLTRRLVLALLERAAEFLASTSALMQKAPADVRREIVAFEREAAMAMTAKAMSATPVNVLKTSALAAELAVRLTISSQADKFRVEFQGEMGGGAAGLFARAELQRLLQMLQAEVVKADWSGTITKSYSPATDETNPTPVRH